MSPNPQTRFEQAQGRYRASEARLTAALDELDSFKEAEKAARSLLRRMKKSNTERERDEAMRNLQSMTAAIETCRDDIADARRESADAQADITALWPQARGWQAQEDEREARVEREREFQARAREARERERRQREDAARRWSRDEKIRQQREAEFQEQHEQARQRDERAHAQREDASRQRFRREFEQEVAEEELEREARRARETRERDGWRRRERQQEWDGEFTQQERSYYEWAQEERAKEEREKLQWESARQSRQQGRERYAHPPKSTPPPPPPTPTKPTPKKPVNRISTAQIEKWHEACATAFSGKTTMHAFPQPPSEPCRNPGCAMMAKSRTLEACSCNIRRLFEGRQGLKRERLMFHPDKFSAVPEDVRDQIQKAAREVFVVVDGMFQQQA